MPLDIEKTCFSNSGLFELFLWAGVMDIDVLLILHEYFPIVSQDQWEENVCGGVCGKQMLVFFCPRVGIANRFLFGILNPLDW